MRKGIALDPIETAIRNALRKGDAGDRAFRARVYRSAFNALHRVLEEGDGTTPAEAAARRDNLKARISEIEAEFAPASPFELDPPIAADEAPRIRVEPEPSLNSVTANAPEIRAERRERAQAEATSPETAPRIEAYSDAPATYPELSVVRNDGAPRGDKRRASGRRSFVAPLAGLAVLILVVVGGWSFLQRDPFAKGPQSEAPGWHPPQTLQEESSSGTAEAPKKEGQADAEQSWITIFSPDDPTTATAGTGAQASVMQEGHAKFLRIVSGAQNGQVTFEVGKGVLEQIAGKHALFDVIARAQEGKDTQMSVNCDFGALGTCERKRYEVGNQRNDFLFEMDMPKTNPADAGKISIVSDIDKQGKAVDIYEIRVSTRQK
jgi:hypothetical protein